MSAINKYLPIRLSGLRIFALVLVLGVTVWTLTTGRLLSKAGGDSETQHLPSRALAGEIYRSGHLPLWNSYESSGIPLAALVQPGAFYPPNIVLYAVLPPVLAFNLSCTFHFLLLAFFTRRYLQTLKLGPEAVALGTAAFTLCGFMLIHNGGIPIFNAAVWIPAVFYCVEKWIQTGRWRYPALAGISLAMTLLAGWAQILLLCSCYVCLYGLLALPSSPRPRHLLSGFVLVFVIASCLVMPQVILTTGFRPYTHLTALSWEFFSSNSYPPPLLLLLLFPAFFGPDSTAFYKPGFWWGPGDSAIMTIYVGILPLMLAAAALPQWKISRVVRFCILALMVAPLMAFGAYTPLGMILYHLPLFQFFRDHWVSFVFFSFAVAVLAAHGVEHLDFAHLSAGTRRRWSAAVPLMFVTIAALTLIESKRLVRRINPAISQFPENWITYFHHTVKFNNPGVLIPALLILACAGFFWAWTQHPRSRTMGRWAVVLVIADLGFFGLSFTAWTSPGQPSSASRQLLDAMRQDSHGRYYRTISIDPDDVFLKVNTNILEHYNDLLGYEPFLPLPYADLLGMNTGGSTALWPQLILNNRIISMLSARYVIAPSSYGVQIERGLSPESTAGASQNLLPATQWRSSRDSNVIEGVKTFQLDSAALGSVFQVDIPIVPDMAYQLSYEARADARNVDVAGMIQLKNEVDLCTVHKYEMATFFQKTTCLYIGPPSLEKAKVIFFTPSKVPITVAHIQLVAVGHLADMVGSYSPRLQAGGMSLFENKNALPHAYFVPSVTPTSSYTDAKGKLWQMDNPLKLRDTALVEGLPGGTISNLNEGTIEDERMRANEVGLRASCPGTCFLVLADSYFPGWHAFVDGRETNIYRTDAVLRGVVVPAGDHDIQFIYRPAGLGWSFLVFSFGLALAGVLVLLDSRSPQPK